jgi:hypothetical protein
MAIHNSSSAFFSMMRGFRWSARSAIAGCRV